MVVYKITNKINGKVYIGQTINSVERRFQRHVSDAMSGRLNTHLANAIRLYGSKSFVIEVIDTADSQDELNHKEQYWIRAYDSVRTGYNETDAISKCGSNTYMSKTNAELDVIKGKLSVAGMGERNSNAHAVKCKNMETSEELIFRTVKECQEFFHKKSHDFITRRVDHEVNSLYLGIWAIVYAEDSYWNYKEFIEQFGIKIPVTMRTSAPESVSTNPDECMGVGPEIGAGCILGNEVHEIPKRETAKLRIPCATEFYEAEDIVSADGDIGETCVEQSMEQTLTALAC